MAIIRVKNLLLRTFIGFNPEELLNRQDVVINLEIETIVPEEALTQDEPDLVYDYKTITKEIIHYVQESRFKLLEVLTKNLLDMIMADNRVVRAKIEVNKPHALRFAKSVSVEMEAFRKADPAGQ